MSNALFGFLGVLVGVLIPLIKEEWIRKRTRKEQATYLAARVICILDEYVDKCLMIVGDNGTIMGQRPPTEMKMGRSIIFQLNSFPEPLIFPLIWIGEVSIAC